MLSATRIAALALAATGIQAAALEVDQTRSVLAVVTHKAGLGKGFAHDHFITAGRFELEGDFDAAAPLDNRAALELAVDDLVVDADELRHRWYPRLAALGILATPFAELSDKERSKIRRAMLGGKQLDKEAYPSIRARIVEVRRRPVTLGDTTFEYEATLDLEIRGTTARRSFAAGYTVDGDEVVVEGVATFRFSDFDIKPYSAMLGLVKNQDEFHVFAHLVLKAGGS